MKIRRTTAQILAAVLCAVLLGGCVSSGTVTDKSHRDEREWVQCGGKPLSCHRQHRRECWRLHLRSERGDLGEVCVPREVWDTHPVGSYYEGGGA